MIAVFCMLDLLLFYGAPCALQFVRNQDQLGVSKGLGVRLEGVANLVGRFATFARDPKALVKLLIEPSSTL